MQEDRDQSRVLQRRPRPQNGLAGVRIADGGHDSSLHQSMGFKFATICWRYGSRNGGSTTVSPSFPGSSSTAKPGPSVAISNRTPFGSRTYKLRNQKRSTLPLFGTSNSFSRSAQPS